MSHAAYAAYVVTISNTKPVGANTIVAVALFSLALLTSVALSVRIIPTILGRFFIAAGKRAKVGVVILLFGFLFACCWLAGLLILAVAQLPLAALGIISREAVTFYSYLCLGVTVPSVLLGYLILVLETLVRKKTH